MLAPSIPTVSHVPEPVQLRLQLQPRTINRQLQGVPRVLTTRSQGSTYIPKTAVGAIIGGTLAGVVLVLIAVFAWRRWRRTRKHKGQDVEHERLTMMVGTPAISSEGERERKSNGSSPQSRGSDVALGKDEGPQRPDTQNVEGFAGSGNVNLREGSGHEVDAGKEGLTRSKNQGSNANVNTPWGFQQRVTPPSPPLTPPMPIPSRPKPLKSALKPSLPTPPPLAIKTPSSSSRKPQPRRKQSNALHTVPEENKHEEEKRAWEAEEKHQSLIMAALSQRWSVLTRSSTSTGGGRHRMSRVSQASSAATGYSQQSAGAIPVGLAYGGD